MYTVVYETSLSNLFHVDLTEDSVGSATGVFVAHYYRKVNASVHELYIMTPKDSFYKSHWEKLGCVVMQIPFLGYYWQVSCCKCVYIV